MANKIQFKRGLKASLPTLSAGEPALCTDTKEVYVGGSAGNIKLVTGEQLAQKAYYEAFGITAQSIPNATWQQMTFNERVVRGGTDINMTSLSNGQINFKEVGVYEIKIVHLTFDMNQTGFRAIRLMPSGTPLATGVAANGMVTTLNAGLNFTVTVPDTIISFEVYQTSGASLNLSTSFHINKL